MASAKEVKGEAKQSLLSSSSSSPTYSDTSDIAEWWYSGSNKGSESKESKGSLTKVVLACCAATLCNVAFGYDVGVLSGSLGDMAESLNFTTIEKEASTSGLNYIAAFGALLISGNVLDRFGRKRTILVSSALLLVGAAFVSFAQNFWVLLIGRAFQGFGSGCSWCACSVYLTELAPTRLRGTLVALADISINVGILLGYVIDYGVYNATAPNGDLRWRLSMGLSVIFPGLFLLSYPWIPETPRWLASKGRKDEALHVLKTFSSDPDMTAEEAMDALTASLDGEESTEASWSEVLCSSNSKTRSMIFVAVTLGFVQQITGTEAILYYTPTVLTDVYGLNAEAMFFANLGVGSCKLFGELVAAYLVERTGRRLLVIGGNFLLSICIFGIALSFHFQSSVEITIMCLCLVMLTFSLGPGPFTFVVVNEMVPLKMRGKAVASSVFMNRLTSGTVAFTFLSMKKSLTGPSGNDFEGAANSFFVYGALGLGSTLFYLAFLPDMAGVALEDVGTTKESNPKTKPQSSTSQA